MNRHAIGILKHAAHIPRAAARAALDATDQPPSRLTNLLGIPPASTNAPADSLSPFAVAKAPKKPKNPFLGR